jgi:hypothetical protein
MDGVMFGSARNALAFAVPPRKSGQSRPRKSGQFGNGIASAPLIKMDVAVKAKMEKTFQPIAADELV